jgi:hypothetical protein
MTQYGVILLKTTSLVMQAEKVLLQAGYANKVIATPRQFSINCGISIRFDWGDLAGVKSSLENSNVEYSAIHGIDPAPVKNN